ncbi:MAG: hypothetical protein ABSF79_10305 [Smithellaceae bacterium]|jgi:hypothetical protein
MHESSLVSLAILKVNWDVYGKDYVECFVPFVVECVRKSADDAVSLPSLQQQLKADFGLDIPLNPLKLILTRAAKRSYLRKEHGIFLRNVPECSETGFRSRQLKVEAIHDGILRKLVEYAKNRHSVEWTEEDASAALHGFLRDNSLSLLFSYEENSILLNPHDSLSGPGFIVCSFITEAQSKDKQVLEDIVAIVQGNLLANALYLPDPGRIDQRFKKTRVYIDTSIIAFAAGYAGPLCAAPSLELISLLSQHGAELYCFRHTQDELRRILDTCAERLLRGRLRDSFGPSMEYFIETGRTASDVEFLAARMNAKLHSLGITIVEKPPYDPKYQVDEKGFEKAIDTEIHYTSPKARIHDVDSISAIARLRRGRESFIPELSFALFVTSNTALAKVTRQFFQPDVSPGTVALCMTDYALENLLWLKNPTKAPDLPRKQLLAHSFAAMKPPDNLWKKYLTEISRLQEQGTISVDDYYILRHTLAAKSTLMDLTLGDDSAFSEGTVQEVLTIAKERLRADLTEALKREQENRFVAENRVQMYEEDRTSRLIKLQSKATKLARIVRHAVFAIGEIIIFVSMCYTFPWALSQPKDAWFRYSLAIILLLLLILSFIHLTRGVTLASLLDRLEQKIAETLTGWFLRFAGLDQDASPDKSGK